MKEHLYYYKAKVKRVIDGDTIVADVDMGFSTYIKDMHIRLLGIDAPEMRGDSKEAGIQSKFFLESIIDQEEIIIRTIKHDSFGRYLANIYHEGICINQLMIEKEHATLYA